MSELTEIFDRNGSDKGSSLHNYGDIYEFLLGRYKNKKCSVLEIGVYKGSSILSWSEFLPDGSIVGIDLDSSFSKHDSKINVEIGNQEDVLFLKKIVDQYGPFDVVIDDGSHLPKSQQISFEFLWPYLKHDGVYVIEDLEVSYVVPYYQSAGYCPTLDYFKSQATLNALRRCAGSSPWIIFAGELLAVVKKG